MTDVQLHVARFYVFAGRSRSIKRWTAWKESKGFTVVGFGKYLSMVWF